MSQCMKSSSADPPWKRLLRELDDPCCPMKYRYVRSRLNALLTNLKPCKVLTRCTSLGRLFSMPIMGDPGPLRSCIPDLFTGCVQAPDETAGCHQGNEDFLVHSDAHSDLVPDLLSSPNAKLHLLLRVAASFYASGRDPLSLALSAAAVAACGALCAFTSPQRAEVLTAVRKRCSPGNYLMPSALSDEAVLQQAEQQLPGAQAALLLTMVEAYLEGSDTAPGRPKQHFSRVVLGAHGPQLGEMELPVWTAVLRLMPAAAAYTAGLADSRPHAATKRCLLAALLTAVAFSFSSLDMSCKADTIGPALQAVQRPALQLALHFERLFVQQRQENQDLPHQHQQYDSATAMANCLCHLRMFAFQIAGATSAVKIRLATELAEKLLQLQNRITQRVASDPLAAGSPWPLVLTAGARGAYSLCWSSNYDQPGDKRLRCDVLDHVRQYVHNFERLQASSAHSGSSQLAALVKNLFAISDAVTESGMATFPDATLRRNMTEGHPANAAVVEVVALQRVLQEFLAARSCLQLLAAPLPPAFKAQRSIELDNPAAEKTWLVLLAGLLAECWDHTMNVVSQQAFPRASTPRLLQPLDAVMLLVSAAAWPLEAVLSDACEADKLCPLLGHTWTAAWKLSDVLKISMANSASAARLPQRSVLARCAVALLAFAQLESIAGLAAPGWDEAAGGPMQRAQLAAAWLRRHPHDALQMKLAEAPNDVTAAAALVRFLSWVTTAAPIATAFAVLAEALAALEAVARTDLTSRQQLTEGGGRWEWAPVAAVLRRRLPRRMAARFLPDVEGVTAAAAGTTQLPGNASGAAAAAAMDSLLLVGLPSDCLLNGCALAILMSLWPVGECKTHWSCVIVSARSSCKVIAQVKQVVSNWDGPPE